MSFGNPWSEVVGFPSLPPPPSDRRSSTLCAYDCNAFKRQFKSVFFLHLFNNLTDYAMLSSTLSIVLVSSSIRATWTGRSSIAFTLTGSSGLIELLGQSTEVSESTIFEIKILVSTLVLSMKNGNYAKHLKHLTFKFSSLFRQTYLYKTIFKHRLGQPCPFVDPLLRSNNLNGPKLPLY